MASTFGRRAGRLARRWGDPVRLIDRAELLYPETALAIALVETGGFRARSLLKSHNWFGFRANARGFQTGEIRRGYGVYATGEQALLDYQAWEQLTVTKHNLYTESEFRAWLPGHYATDPAYAAKLTKALHLLTPTDDER